MKGFYSTALEVYLYDLRWVDNHAPSRSILEVFLPQIMKWPYIDQAYLELLREELYMDDNIHKDSTFPLHPYA